MAAPNEGRLAATYDFAGRVALVTGAASGIGRASALAFARAGASVMVADVETTGGEDTVAQIRAAGGNALFHRCDVSMSAEVSALVERTVEKFGRLDFAHNNAGISSVARDEFDDAMWNESIAVNLSSMMYCLRAEGEAMLPRGRGAIVNTASIAGLSGNPVQPAYVASKHGVVGLTRHFALRWAEQGIRVNAVCPGIIETPMTAPMFADPAIRQIMSDMTPMKRWGRPEEIAAAVLWLCSDDASFVTGHPLCVDGGSMA